MQRRKYNYRPTWPLKVNEPVSDNYYPVNTLCFINDTSTNYQFNIITDRSRGVGSLKDGEIELMLHRRLLYDDGRGVGEALNQTNVIKTTDLIFLNTHKNSANQYRKLIQHHNYPFVLLFSSKNYTSMSDFTKNFKTSWTPMATTLPPNVRLETMRTKRSGAITFRLAHLYSYDEDAVLSKPATINLLSLFSHLEPFEMTEMILTGQQPLSASKRLYWKTGDNSGQDFKTKMDSQQDPFTITLLPMEIKTFEVRFRAK